MRWRIIMNDLRYDGGVAFGQFTNSDLNITLDELPEDSRISFEKELAEEYPKEWEEFQEVRQEWLKAKAEYSK